MLQQQRYSNENPWYIRGYVPRFFGSPRILISFICTLVLIGFGTLFIIGGIIALNESKRADNTSKKNEEDPKFQNDFFKKAREEHKKSIVSHTGAINVNLIIGIILITVGGIFLFAAIGTGLIAKCYMDKRNINQNNPVTMPLNEDCVQQGSHPPPTDGSYPQQPPPLSGSYPQQYTPVPGSYSQQPVMTSYPQQVAPPHTYPYPPLNQQSETTAPYAESQASTFVHPPPVGFKKG